MRTFLLALTCFASLCGGTFYDDDDGVCCDIILYRSNYEHLGLSEKEIDDLMEAHGKAIADWMDEHIDEFREMFQE